MFNHLFSSFLAVDARRQSPDLTDAWVASQWASADGTTPLDPSGARVDRCIQQADRRERRFQYSVAQGDLGEHLARSCAVDATRASLGAARFPIWLCRTRCSDFWGISS